MGEAMAELIRRWIDELHELAAETRGEDPLDRLAVLTERLFASYERSRPAVIGFIEVLAQAERSPELREQLAACYRALRVSVARVVAEVLGWGEDSDDQAQALASLLMAFADGLMIQWLLDPDATPREEALLAAVDGVVRGTDRERQSSDDRGPETVDRRSTG